MGGRVSGQLTLGSNAGDFFNGDLAEVVVYDSQISELKKDSIEFYLIDKYSPPINLGLDKTVCSFPDSVEVNIDYALGFQWSTGDTTNKTIIDSAGKYYLTITDMFERTSVDSIVFYQDTNNYMVDFGFTDTTICRLDSILITAGPEQYQYQWSSNDQSNSLFVSTKGTYNVTVTNCFSSVSVDSFRLLLNEPVFSLGADTTGCFNNLPVLSPDSNFSNASYLWSNGETTNSIVVDSSAQHGLTVTDNFQCSFSDTVLVSIDSSLLSISLGYDTSLCVGNTIALISTDSSIINYSWSTGDTSPQTIVDSNGFYKLTVSNNFCQNADTIFVNIQGDAPSPNFTFNNLCFLDAVRFSNTSVAPTAAFTILNNGNGAPYRLKVENLSANNDNNLWLFGTGDSSSSELPNYIYLDTGDYQLQLIVESINCCRDTLERTLTVTPYFLDAAIQELELQENSSGFLNLRVRLLNVGNNTIDDVHLIATLNNQLSIEEFFQESIYKGDSKGYLFSSAFSKGDNDALNFVCVRIGNVNGLSDEVAENNQLCEEGFSSQFFIQLYPNPSSSNVNIEYVLPEDGNLSILLYDALGRKLNTIVENSFFSKGFYTSLLDVSTLKSGIYRVAFRYNGVEEVKSIIVQ